MTISPNGVSDRYKNDVEHKYAKDVFGSQILEFSFMSTLRIPLGFKNFFKNETFFTLNMDEFIEDIREASYKGDMKSLEFIVERLKVDVNEPHTMNQRTGNSNLWLLIP